MLCYCHAEWRYAGCRYAECRGAGDYFWLLFKSYERLEVEKANHERQFNFSICH
jgi:hypothetical protein